MSNKTILITGVSSGIGASAALELASEGYRIIGLARNKEKIEAFSEQIEGEKNIFDCVDLEDEASTKSFLKSIKKEDIKLSGIVCSAGSHEVRPLRITKKKDYERLFSANFLSVSNVISNVTRILDSPSSIVIISSAGVIRAASAVSSYVSSKMALEGLMRSAALEFAPMNVRINCILPGVVETDMTKEFLSSIGQEAADEVRSRHPLGLGEPEDVAGLIKYLLSDRSKWITGQSIVIDGGFSIQG